MWYVTVGGVQLSLDVRGEENRAAAVAAVERLVRERPADPPPPTGPTLGEAVGAFLERTARRVKPHTLVNYRQFTDRLLEAVPADTPLASVTADRVERVADRPTWSSSTRHDFLGLVGVVFRQAGHPLALRRPPKESRGADACWTEQEFWQVYGAALGDFKPFLLVLKDTGCRPSEAAALTAEGIDWTHWHCRLKQHKNAGKGKARVIHFPESLRPVLSRQRDEYPEGHLFRDRGGKPFSMAAVLYRVIRARTRAGVTRPVTAYGLRHWYICRALEAGMTGDQVAALVGNSPAMIAKHYSHIGQNQKFMSELANRLAPKAG